MGLALSFLLWCGAIGLFAACAIPFLILSFIGFWKRYRLIQFLGCIPAFIIIASACVLFYFLVDSYANPSQLEITNPQDIRSSFKANVGIEPGPDVVPLREKIYAFGNIGCLHLTFRASSATFDQITSLGFNPVSVSEFSSATAGDAPAWWKEPSASETGCYKNLHWIGAFNNNKAYLFYDRDSGIIYFYSEGND
jgi:hypothetical protein